MDSIFPSNKHANSLLHAGTSGWSYDDWQGNFYPPKTSSGQWLEYYISQFGAVEVDSTFYAIPPRSRVERWAEVAPPGFEFALKVPQVITHEKSLINCEAEMSEFLSVVELLGEHLGPVLFQFPYGFKPERINDLLKFLDTLPRDTSFRFAVEIRNRAWLKTRLPDELAARKLTMCLVDHPWMPRETRVTGTFVYLRFLGDQKALTVFDHTQKDMQKNLVFWAACAKLWLKQKLPIYAFFNNHFSGHAPSDVRAFSELLKGQKAKVQGT
ncbi:MAG TPA: DUF72 domain-containing protein [bacterium]|jgi:uncharacterized protein YecE (DUF72 family)